MAMAMRAHKGPRWRVKSLLCATFPTGTVEGGAPPQDPDQPSPSPTAPCAQFWTPGYSRRRPPTNDEGSPPLLKPPPSNRGEA